MALEARRCSEERMQEIALELRDGYALDLSPQVDPTKGQICQRNQTAIQRLDMEHPELSNLGLGRTGVDLSSAPFHWNHAFFLRALSAWRSMRGRIIGREQPASSATRCG